MKIPGLLLSMFGLCSCAAITANPWSWLDQPDEQIWAEVSVNAPGREIVFSVPDRKNKWGEHIRRWPEPEKGQINQVIDLPVEVLYEEGRRIVYFEWEWYWGGFYKPGEEDFSLDVWIVRSAENPSQLDLTVDERIQQRKQYHHDQWGNGRPDRQKDIFFEQYWIEPFSSDTGLNWIVENQPQTTSSHQIYRIPISNHHVLKFSFFVREDRQSGPADPDWMERRWEVARKIMNTVRITPSPHSGSSLD